MAEKHSHGTEAEMTFEEAFHRLGELAQTLEEGKLTLEQTTHLYEEGMNLAKLCNRLLNATEVKITQLKDAYLEEISAASLEDDDQIA